MVDVIRSKRDGHALSDAEIDWVIGSYVERRGRRRAGRGAADGHLLARALGRRAARAGRARSSPRASRMDLYGLSRPTVDKHSTGWRRRQGVAHPCAARGGLRGRRPAAVGPGPRPHGRHPRQAGGDPGLAVRALQRGDPRPAREVGCVICAAGAGLAPADRKLYALRDVTGTVESIPLIAGSIMSKKIAEGTESLVLDVKVGSGAFMASRDRARRARPDDGRPRARPRGQGDGAAHARWTLPSGARSGNALEVTEAVEVLSGGRAGRPRGGDAGARPGDARAGRDHGPIPPPRFATAPPSTVTGPWSQPRGATPTRPCPGRATSRRWPPTEPASWSASTPAPSAWRRGGSGPGGRARRTPSAPPPASSASRSPASDVKDGQGLFELHTDEPERLDWAREAVAGAVSIGDQPLPAHPLVLELIV